MEQKPHYSLVDNESVLLDVYKLACEESENSDSTEFILDISLIDVDIIEKSKLYQYLNNLDSEQIKIVQTVMYIGRDHESPSMTEEELKVYYERKAEYPDYERPKQPLCVEKPDDYLNEMVEYLGRVKSWQEKSIEIDIIMGKTLRLPDYLLRGFKILGIVEE